MNPVVDFAPCGVALKVTKSTASVALLCLLAQLLQEAFDFWRETGGSLGEKGSAPWIVCTPREGPLPRQALQFWWHLVRTQ